jgi:ribonuclease P protein component
MNKPQGFAKWERLCRRSAISKLFAEGKSLKVYPIRLLFLKVTEAEARQAILPSLLPQVIETPRIQVLISVPKRNIRKAVHRNLVKRRLREAFRKAKGELLIPNSHYYIVGIVYMAREVLPYPELDDKLNQALQRLAGTSQSGQGRPD